MWQWLIVLYINCANHASEIKLGHAPEVDSLHRLTTSTGKHSNINISKAGRRILIKLYTHSITGQKERLHIGLGRSDLNSGCRGKKKKKKKKKHEAHSFGMWQWLMVVYINCANHAPGLKFGQGPGVDSLHRLFTLCRKTFTLLPHLLFVQEKVIR